MSVNPNHASIGGTSVPLDCPGGYYVNGTQVISSAGAIIGDIQATAGSIGTAELADSSITPVKVAETASATATADGLTTGLIAALTGFKKFVAVTSSAATNAITLPAATAATIGQEVFLTVGANGYELLTPAASGATINQVDSDGTNQLDVAANTLVRCTQTGPASWIAEQIAATGISVVAPDND